LEFAVNIALCQDGKPVLGVIYVPTTRDRYYSDNANGMAYKSVADKAHILVQPIIHEKDRILPAQRPEGCIKVVGSRSHMNAETEFFITQLNKKFNLVEMLPKGSSLKFYLVPKGKAHLYSRFGPTMEWGTEAGNAYVEA
jgi:3'(2'), 5'-bisphosphate nucleotidase